VGQDNAPLESFTINVHLVEQSRQSQSSTDLSSFNPKRFARILHRSSTNDIIELNHKTANYTSFKLSDSHTQPNLHHRLRRGNVGSCDKEQLLLGVGVASISATKMNIGRTVRRDY
jgi:hypothetical protein